MITGFCHLCLLISYLTASKQNTLDKQLVNIKNKFAVLVNANNMIYTYSQL